MKPQNSLSTPSKEALSEVLSELSKDSSLISEYISKMKGGEVSSSESSKFRARRLTYAHKTNESPEAMSPISVKRTTIYTSAEPGMQGLIQTKEPPFSRDILGTYSHHGIEPNSNGIRSLLLSVLPPLPSKTIKLLLFHAAADGEDDDEDCIHDKIHQDRGCVVYPLNGNEAESLLMVLDGHGEQGDRVSEFVMRQVFFFNCALCLFCISYPFPLIFSHRLCQILRSTTY